MNGYYKIKIVLILKKIGIFFLFLIFFEVDFSYDVKVKLNFINKYVYKINSVIFIF